MSIISTMQVQVVAIMVDNKRALPLNFNLQSVDNLRWAISIEGVAVMIQEMANLICVVRWINEELKKPWNWSFPMMEASPKAGEVALLDPAWVMEKNPWSL